jgi:hypothetical protein
MGFGAFMKGFQGGHEWAEAAGERARKRGVREATGEAWRGAQVEQAIPTEQSVMIGEQNEAFADEETGALPTEATEAEASAQKKITATDWDKYEATLGEKLLANGELDAYQKAKGLASELRRDRFNETFKGAMMAKRAGNQEQMVAKMNQLGQYMPGMDHLEFDIDNEMDTPRVKGSDGKWHDVDDDWLMATHAMAQSPEKWFTMREALREAGHKETMRPHEVRQAESKSTIGEAEAGSAKGYYEARADKMTADAITAGVTAENAPEMARLGIKQAEDNLKNGPVNRDFTRMKTLLTGAQKNLADVKAKEAKGVKLTEADLANLRAGTGRVDAEYAGRYRPRCQHDQVARSG